MRSLEEYRREQVSVDSLSLDELHDLRRQLARQPISHDWRDEATALNSEDMKRVQGRIKELEEHD